MRVWSLVTSERPGARSQQELEAEEHGGRDGKDYRDVCRMSEAELCLDPSIQKGQSALSKACS